MTKQCILILSFFAFILTLGLAGHNMTVHAGEREHQVEHYEGKAFTKKKQAMQALIKTSAQMAEIAAAETLNVTQMEQIHQTSYVTEDAVMFLKKKSKYNLTPLAEKLEKVHLAAEDHEADMLRRNFILYQAALVHYMAAQ